MSDRRFSLVSEQFSKFVVVGGLSTILNYVVFLVLLKYFGLPYMLASAIGFFAGMAVGFRLNRDWTYQSQAAGKSQLIHYLILYTLSLLAGLSFLRVLVEIFDLTPTIANLATIALTTVINFIGTKLWVFRA